MCHWFSNLHQHPFFRLVLSPIAIVEWWSRKLPTCKGWERFCVTIGSWTEKWRESTEEPWNVCRVIFLNERWLCRLSLPLGEKDWNISGWGTHKVCRLFLIIWYKQSIKNMGGWAIWNGSLWTSWKMEITRFHRVQPQVQRDGRDWQAAGWVEAHTGVDCTHGYWEAAVYAWSHIFISLLSHPLYKLHELPKKGRGILSPSMPVTQTPP